MSGPPLNRRDFIQFSLAGSALFLSRDAFTRAAAPSAATSPGCKARIAKLYIGTPHPPWPTPLLDIEAEMRRYEAEFARRKDELAGVEFVTSTLVTSPDQVRQLRGQIASADGILVIHLGISVGAIIDEILAAKQPTMFFAAPYSGHEWAGLGALQKSPRGALLSCILTSDMNQLVAAVRPIRAIRYMKESKLLNVTAQPLGPYADAVKKRFGTSMQVIKLDRVMDLYRSIPEEKAKAEAAAWIKGAMEVREPSHAEVVKSCRMALAFEKLLKEENANALTVECYGSMYEPLCKKVAFPCVGFVRLNDMGMAGICESDLESAVTFLIFRGLTGRPSFISDPTIDESKNGIILAHCLGTRKMDGPAGPMAPYRLRTIHERQEGCVPQVFMRVGQRVTQGRLVGTETLPYFTGEIVETPDVERGCRTKITVKVDGDATRLWQNWANGLHRLTCYGDIRRDLEHYCRFMKIKMVNEAV
jgi:hypothetical protein